MKIGILQSAGIAADIVAQALAQQEIFELVEPVIYSKENQNDKNVLPDFRDGKIDAIVVAPGANLSIPNSTVLSLTDQTRVCHFNEDEATHVQQIEQLWRTMKRDFCITNARIAVVTDTDAKEAFVKEQKEKGIYVYGPYELNHFIEEQEYIHFDAVIAATPAMEEMILSTITSERICQLIIGMPAVLMLCPGTLPEALPANSEEAEERQRFLAPYTSQLRQALFTATDIVRSRRIYDKATASPLPKLYHERRDDSEKVRFAVKKEQ